MCRAALFALLLLSACNKSSPTDTGTPNGPVPQDKVPPMTDLDPKSPTAWKQAEAIAATAAHGALVKRSDALPFMFMADSPPAVLVHKGHVVRERGAKIAGEYLRDLGIIDGTGPKIEDVLFVLFALDAWPPITGAAKEGYVNAPGDKSLADVTAAVEFDGVTARVTLVYFLGQPVMPKGGSASPAPGDEHGGMDPDHKHTMVRPMARCTLEIAKTGDTAWKIEKLNRAE